MYQVNAAFVSIRDKHSNIWTVTVFLFFWQTPSSGEVPYLGTYLTVLTMLDTALSDNVEVRFFSDIKSYTHTQWGFFSSDTFLF